jgi:long-chain acyl-CoA synthetase
MAFATLNECLRYGASHHFREDAFLVREAPGRVRAVSTREHYHQARLLTLGLHAMDIKKGDRVAIVSENRYEWALADMAVLFAGAVVVPLYPNASDEQWLYILKDSGAKAAFVSNRALFSRFVSLRGSLPDLKHVIGFDRLGAENGQDVLNLDDVVAKGRPLWEQNQDLHRQLLEVTAGDLATLVYTSGTTGEPKGVMLTHGNLAANLQATVERKNVHREDVALSFLPLCHIFERLTDYCYMFTGASIAHVPDPKLIPDYIREIRPSVFAAVPRFYEKLYDEILNRSSKGWKAAVATWAFRKASAHAAFSANGDEDGSEGFGYRAAEIFVFSKIRKIFDPRLRFMISGGAPLNPRIAEFFYGIGIPILPGYGLTETAPVLCLNPHHRIKFDTVGPPLRGVDIRIAPDGEILAKGANVMKGYWNKEEATREAFTEDGWLKTGDIGELDKDSYLRITGRKKDLIVTAGGKNVAPVALEHRLTQSPYVEQAAVFGDQRKFISALVVPKADALRKKGIADAGSLQAYALIEKDLASRMADLSDYEQVKKFTLLREPFSVEDGTLTPTMKLRRRELLKKYADVIDSMYR